MNFEEYIKTNGYIVYTNVGGSMLPLLREGRDLMVIEKINKPLKFFDAVLFRRPNIKGRGEYVLHRIVKCNKDGTYYIIGDNCYTGEVVKEENILGLLSRIKRGKKEINCESISHKIYVYLWYLTYPIRFCIHIVWAIIRKIFKL